jgi:hypothetical protein
MSIIVKISKLLRKGKDAGSTPQEAAAFLNKAQQLAAAHGINLTELPETAGTAASPLTHQTIKIRKGLAERLASAIVKTHFGVDCLTVTSKRRSHLYIIGMPSQVEISIYIYTCTVRLIRESWDLRENKRLRDRTSYLRGFACAISEKVPQIYPSTALVLCRHDYIATQIVNPLGNNLREIAPPKLKPLAKAATIAGYQAGQKAPLHQALRQPNQQGCLAI